MAALPQTNAYLTAVSRSELPVRDSFQEFELGEEPGTETKWSGLLGIYIPPTEKRKESGQDGLEIISTRKAYISTITEFEINDKISVLFRDVEVEWKIISVRSIGEPPERYYELGIEEA